MPKSKSVKSSNSSPRQPAVANDTNQPSSTNVTPSPRKRLRAANFASKGNSSSKKRNVRRRLDVESDGDTPTGSVDRVLRNVRNVVQKRKDKNDNIEKANDDNSELAEALKRADQYFREDVTDSSSSSDEGEDNVKSVVKDVPKVSAVSSVKARLDKLKMKPPKQPQPQKKKGSEQTPSKKNPKEKRASKIGGDAANGDQDLQTLSKSIISHKKDIDALKKEDPNFYKFLEENDSALLDLDELSMDDLGDDGDDEQSDGDDSDDDDENDGDESEDSGDDNEKDGGDNVDDEENDNIKAEVDKSDDKEEEEEAEEDSEDDVHEVATMNAHPGKGTDGKILPVSENTIDKPEKSKNGSPEMESDSSDDSEGNSDDSEDEPAETVIDTDNDNTERKNDPGVNGEEDREDNTAEDETEEGDNDVAMEDAPGANDSLINDDKTGYSDDDDESDEEEAKAAAEAGVAGTFQLGDVEGETDDEVYEEESDEEADGGEREPTSEGEAGEEEGDDEGEDEDDDDFDMADDAKSGEAGSKRKGQPKVTVVDLQYLRNLKDELKTRRALAACKELLKVFRAGRNILPKSTVDDDKSKKGKQRAFANREVAGKDVDGDTGLLNEDTADGAFVAGKVRFVSSKAYQQAMNLAIIGIQDGVDRMLGKPQTSADQSKTFAAEKAESKWNPTSAGRWANLQPLYRQFLQYLIVMCERTTDPITLRFLLKRLEKTAPYLVATGGSSALMDDEVDEEDDGETRKGGRGHKLSKRVVRTAVRVWSSDAKVMSEVTRLQAYLLLSRLARVNAVTETVLRACYHAYYTRIAATCNSKTLPLIEFSIACMVELFGVNMGASYAAGFSYIRELAMGLRSVLVSKDNPQLEVERVHNWSYINQLRLWSRVLGRYGDPNSELHPLVYPYVQVAIGVLRAYPSPRTFPLRLHIASFLNSVVAETGTFIPVVQQLIPLLRCAELKRRHFTPAPTNTSNGPGAKSKGKAKSCTSGPNGAIMKKLDWRSLLRVPDEVVKTKEFLNGLVDSVTLEIGRFFATICRHVAMPEIAYVAETALRRVSREISVPEWKIRIVGLAGKLSESSKLVMEARTKADNFSPQSAVMVMLKDKSKGGRRYGMLRVVPGLEVAEHEKDSMKKKMPVERWYVVEKQRVDKEYTLRDEKGDAMRRKTKKKRRADGDEEGDEEDGDDDEIDEDGDDDDDEEGGMGEDEHQDTRAKSKKHKKAHTISIPDAPQPVMDVDKAGAEVDYVGTLDLDSD